MKPPIRTNSILRPEFLVIQSAISLMMGISFALQFPNIPLYILQVAALILGSLVLIFRKYQISHIIILLFICVLGTLITTQKLQPPQVPHIRSFIETQRTITCSGVITETLASNAERVRMKLSVGTIYSKASLERIAGQPKYTTKKQDNLFATSTYGMVQLSMPAFPHEHLQPGDIITLKAKISPPRGFVNPGGFRLPFFLQSQNILLSGWVPNPNDIVKHQATPKISTQPFIHAEKIRSNLISFFNASLSQSNASLYRALVTGDRSGLTSETEEMFKNIGTYHLLAISGIHMGLLAGFCMWLASRLMQLFPRTLLHIPRQQGAAILAMLPIIFYCFISGLHPPAVRACLMTIILFSGFIFRKQFHGPTAIAIAAIIILIDNPMLLAMVSFQLSFTAVTAIVLILPLLKSYFLEQKTKPTVISTIIKTVVSGFFISVVATFATLPLLLFHFNRISLISPLTTLIIEPLLCFWALGFGLAGSLCFSIAPYLATTLLHIGSLGFEWTLWIGEHINAIPHINIWLPPPSIWKILLYYGSIFLVFILPNKLSKAFFILCFIILFTPTIRNLQSDKITFIDVGKGNSSLIETTTGEIILIDCGGPSSINFNVGRQIIAPLLFHKQIRKIDLLILSHADLDHYSGATFLINTFHPKELWVPYIHADNEQWVLMYETAKKQGVTIRIPKQNEAYELQGQKSLMNLSNTHLTQQKWSQNAQSLVIRFNSKQYSFLFPGDIEERSESLLIRQNSFLESTVIVAPHHGSKSSSTLPFLHAVNPRYVIFSSSLYGTTPFPAKSIENRYVALGTVPLKTAINGAITFSIKQDQLTMTTCLP